MVSTAKTVRTLHIASPVIEFATEKIAKDAPLFPQIDGKHITPGNDFYDRS
jgi:hypothetical protein